MALPTVGPTPPAGAGPGAGLWPCRRRFAGPAAPAGLWAGAALPSAPANEHSRTARSYRNFRRPPSSRERRRPTIQTCARARRKGFALRGGPAPGARARASADTQTHIIFLAPAGPTPAPAPPWPAAPAQPCGGAAAYNPSCCRRSRTCPALSGRCPFTLPLPAAGRMKQ